MFLSYHLIMYTKEDSLIIAHQISYVLQQNIYLTSACEELCSIHVLEDDILYEGLADFNSRNSYFQPLILLETKGTATSL